ncbi:hypothetical protein J2Y45_003642 [Dyadobacter sp. BE34]|uniref:Lipoprotein n=1 Tax=Dyadobacter fermentans TaxID=94254 RepID=A0ABU1R0G3_9BACT|nr:hypothetical protein [Dyadobacter fermentans]MDR7044191.1 hypothetical protein [Dyadobacter sp. BE242]MDR7198502.1 hypothetical protein [Dyadobacter sp. BE34]MDR7216464.1 hypothetical protein [Dyadobacter sp. BE31]
MQNFPFLSKIVILTILCFKNDKKHDKNQKIGFFDINFTYII